MLEIKLSSYSYKELRLLSKSVLFRSFELMIIDGNDFLYC